MLLIFRNPERILSFSICPFLCFSIPADEYANLCSSFDQTPLLDTFPDSSSPGIEAGGAGA